MLLRVCYHYGGGPFFHTKMAFKAKGENIRNIIYFLFDSMIFFLFFQVIVVLKDILILDCFLIL